MKIVSINNLKPGMVISEDVFSYHGQCLAKQNTPVTLQLIEHLKFYQIASVSIFPENHGDRNSSTMTAQRLETYSQRIRRSPEFQRFKTDYTKKVSFMKENINNFIVNDEDLNVDQLLDETLTLFGENSTTISMFDMLHNMRQIDDSTYAHSVNVALICRLISFGILDFPISCSRPQRVRVSISFSEKFFHLPIRRQISATLTLCA